MDKRLKKTISLQDILKNYIAEKNLSSPLKKATVKINWPEIVGPFIAEQTEVIKVDGNCLFVRVKQSAWKTELEFAKLEILKKIKLASDGEIVKIKFI
jgi:predicted nucleic acid-binding Zn ribbon protein